MWLIFLSICLGFSAIGVLLAMTVGTRKSKRASLRLAALDQEFTPTDYEDRVADIRKAERKLSAIPWLNYGLNRMNLGPATSLYLYQAGVTLSIGALSLISIGGAVFTGWLLYLRFGTLFPALILSGVFLPLPFLYVQRKRTRRLYELEQQIPDALAMMVSALRVGHSLIASLGTVARESAEPIAGEMRKCFEERNYGVDLGTALLHLTERAPVQDLRIFAAAVMIQRDSGGNLAEVLEKVAQTTRDRFRLKKQVLVHTAQGRMTGWVLSFLPVVLGIGLYLANPEGVSMLWKRPLGLKMLATAIVMDTVGALIIRKIVSIRI